MSDLGSAGSDVKQGRQLSGVLPVEALLRQARGKSLKLVITQADQDGDGTLSMEEVLQVLVSERRQKKDKKRLGVLAAVLGTILVVMLAANAGLTYAVVALSKDTSTASDGVMTVKGDDNQIVQTATATQTLPSNEHLLYLTAQNASEIRDVSLVTPQGNLLFFQIVGGLVTPGERTVLYTSTGVQLVVTDRGLQISDPANFTGTVAPAGSNTTTGRRLLAGPTLAPNFLVTSTLSTRKITELPDAASGMCGQYRYRTALGTCADCNRQGCQDCRACQIGDTAGSCGPQNDQYCIGICKYGFFTDNAGSCKPCNPGCADCRTCFPAEIAAFGCSNGFCTTCSLGLTLVNGKCLACPAGCARCGAANQCLQCSAGYYLNSGNCYPCSAIPQLSGCAACELCTTPEITKGEKFCWGGVKCSACIAGFGPALDGTRRCKRN